MIDFSEVIIIGEDNIIFWHVEGPAKTEKEAFEFATSLKEYIDGILSSDSKQQYRLLVEISPSVSSVFLPAVQRRIYFDIFSSPQFGKMAVVVKDSFFKMVVGYFAKELGRAGQTESFSEKEEALAWLREV